MRLNPRSAPWGTRIAPPKFIKIDAPPLLSIVRNPEGVSAFISRLQQSFDRGQPVNLVLRNITQIDYDGITVLLSVVVRFKSKRILVKGDFPEDEGVRAILEESGFFDYLTKKKFPDRDSYTLRSNSILTHAKTTVDSVLGEKLIAAASETVWGTKRRCPGIQRTFIELMQNTNNHASMEKEGEKHWWLSVKHVKEEHRVAFSFVDYGVGVFYSLRHKPTSDKFYNILDRILQIFGLSDDAEILRFIFSGDLHRTASGKPFRGKGLPGIYEAMKKNALSNFTIVTNRVFYSAQNETYRMLDNEFRGTFVYWELSTDNISLPA